MNFLSAAGTIAVNATATAITDGFFDLSDGGAAQVVTGGGVEMVYEPIGPPLQRLYDPLDITNGGVLFGIQGDRMTFASGVKETEKLRLSLQRDVIAGTTSNNDDITGFSVGMAVPELPVPSARLLALAALGALEMLRGRLRGRA